MDQNKSLDEQLAITAQWEKLQREIACLEKQAQAERQPKKKFELVQETKQYRQKMEELS